VHAQQLVMPDPKGFVAICEEFGIELLGPTDALPS
jgi:hypothetical protein